MDNCPEAGSTLNVEMLSRLLLATNVNGPLAATCGSILVLEEPQPITAVMMSSEEIVQRNLDFMGKPPDGQRRFEGACLNLREGEPNYKLRWLCGYQALILYFPPEFLL
jgi:hypothetical protein